MPQIDYSIGFTAAEVEEILAIQKSELKKTLSAYADNGSSVTKRRIDEIHAVIAACQRALQKLDPAKYPPTVRVGASYVDSDLEL
ncbi:hypothetical protein H5P28_00855 [Ruficoccus amylovorans]|uniref:Uncharacterized protein n=1 Tax=Ruficoccus amylovorans TaxID=1804625 RepID=A0A842H8Z3_9BACT|nr:hypothetical protein [Ruficoccus amylovorans]MBC2592800.1 hypothetical protein [Ruficoccus amylovorans]